tara:strand:- start:620 stop:1174 length:555 start_codon:yes stop_codon:yes gene_type:complete
MRVARPTPPPILKSEFPFVRRKERYESDKEWRRERQERILAIKRLIRLLQSLDSQQKSFNNQVVLELHEELSTENGSVRAKAISLFRNRFRTRKGKSILTESDVVERVDLLVTAFIEEKIKNNTLAIMNDSLALKKFAASLKRVKNPTHEPISPPTIPVMSDPNEAKNKLFSQIAHPYVYTRQL